MGVVCSEDGVSPSMTHGSQSGLLVTNISTELSGIALAIRMIMETTKTLPEVYNGPNARSRWLAACISNTPNTYIPDPPPSFTILSDCQYAIDACLTYASPTHTYWIEARRNQRALHKLQARGVRVTLDWIPGHCGHPLGDLADATAKSHSTNPLLPSYPSKTTPTPLKVAQNFIKARAHAWILPIWWSNLHILKPQRLFAFQPHPNTLPPILKHISAAKNRTQTSIYRLLLGQANNNNNMYHCGMRSSSTCSLCPFPKDSSDHRILDCPAYLLQRSALVKDLRKSGLTLSIPTIIGLKNVPPHHHPSVTDALIKFLDTTKLTHLFVWDNSAQDTQTAPPSIPLPPPSTATTHSPTHGSSTIQSLITQYLPSQPQ